jgi:hypothetical protein
MMASGLRLKVLVEFVTYARMTASSTPDSASRITSDVGLAGFRLAGSGFSTEMG